MGKGGAMWFGKKAKIQILKQPKLFHLCIVKNPAMISKMNLKLIRSLQHKKYRDQHGLFVVEGEKMVLELISASARSGLQPEKVFATSEWLKKHGEKLDNWIQIVETSTQELVKASNLVSPQAVLALVKVPHVTGEIKKFMRQK